MLNRRDRAVVLIALLILIFVTYLLVTDQNVISFEQAYKGDLIGQIFPRGSDTRQKHPTSYTWDKVASPKQIFEGDSIYTGSDSTAQINLDDGTTIQVQPESLIVVTKTSKNSFSLDLQFGRVETVIAESTKIGTDGNSFSLKGQKRAKLKFEKARNGATIVQSLFGSVELLSAGKTLALQENKQVQLSGATALDLVKKELQQSPKPSIPPPIFIQPEPGQNFVQSLDFDGKILYEDILVRWEFEPAQDPNFRLNLLDLRSGKSVGQWDVNAYTFKLSKLNAGRYQLELVHVRTQTKSAPLVFTVENGTQPKLETPQLLVESKDHSLTPSMDAKALDRLRPLVKWAPVRGADRYLVEIRSSGQKAPTQLKFSAKQTEYRLPKIGPGEIQIQVKAQTHSGIESSFSDKLLYRYFVTAPILKKQEDYVVRGKNPSDKPRPINVKLEWTGVPFTREYEVEYARNVNFTSSKVLITSRTLVSVSVETPGAFYWRVRPIGNFARNVASLSKPEYFSYIFLSPLQIPKPLSPKDKFSILLQSKQKFQVSLTWERVSGAKEYEVEISKNKNFKADNIVFTKKVKFTSLLLEKFLGEHQFYWRVRASSANGVSEWSEVRSFRSILAESQW